MGLWDGGTVGRWPAFVPPSGATARSVSPAGLAETVDGATVAADTAALWRSIAWMSGAIFMKFGRAPATRRSLMVGRGFTGNGGNGGRTVETAESR